MTQTPQLQQHAPWLLAIGCLVVALVHLGYTNKSPAPAQPAIVQLAADANGLGARVPHVLVNGVASIDVVPDVVEVSVTLSVEKPSASEAVEVMQAQQAELVESLAAAGVSGSDLQTSQLRISPAYDSSYSGRSKIRGYEASVTVVATTDDFDSIDDLLERAASFELGYASTQFRSTQLQAKKRELRDMALNAARDKAEQSAATLGIQLGQVLSVQELGQGSYGAYGMSNAFANEYVSMPTGDGEGMTPGAIPISLTVAVEYAIVG